MLEAESALEAFDKALKVCVENLVPGEKPASLALADSTPGKEPENTAVLASTLTDINNHFKKLDGENLEQQEGNSIKKIDAGFYVYERPEGFRGMIKVGESAPRFLAVTVRERLLEVFRASALLSVTDIGECAIEVQVLEGMSWQSRVPGTPKVPPKYSYSGGHQGLTPLGSCLLQKGVELYKVPPIFIPS